MASLKISGMRLVAWVLFACLACPPALAQDAASCAPLRPVDSVVTLAFDSGYSGFVEAPQPVVRDGQHWLFGRNGLLWQLEPGGLRARGRVTAGFIVENARSVADIPLPRGSAYLLAPAVRPTGDRIHVIWGDGPDEITYRVQVLRFADFGRASWGAVDSLVLDRALYWTPLSRSRLEARGDTLFLVAPHADLGDSTAFLRRVNGVWSHREIPSGHRNYATLAVTPTELIVLGIGIRTGHRNPSPGVFIQTSRDGGETWSDEEMIVSLGGRSASDPRLIVDADETLVAVWSTSMESGPDNLSDAIGVARRDSTQRWTPGAAIPIQPYWPLWVTPALGRGFHAIARRMDEGDLYYVRWTPGATCAGSLPGAEGAVPSPAIVEERGDTIRVYWTHRLLESSRMPVTQTRRFVTCCAAR